MRRTSIFIYKNLEFLANSMNRSTSREADSISESQGIWQFIGHEGSLPFSQKPATRPYSELDESSPHPPTLFKIQFNFTFPSAPSSPKWYLPLKVSD
jgi:hypothetical protein